jgi:hypothetical protein
MLTEKHADRKGGGSLGNMERAEVWREVHEGRSGPVM